MDGLTLTEQQQNVSNLLSLGLTNKQIAKSMNIKINGQLGIAPATASFLRKQYVVN